MINGIITDYNVPKGYECFDTIPTIGMHYSSDIRNGTDVKTCVESMPEFEEVYKLFLDCKIFPIFRNKKLDICLSLFYKPFFDEFYEKFKQDYRNISASKKKFLAKYLLTYLSSEVHYKIIVEESFLGKEKRDYYIEKDIYVKSKELLKLIK